MKKIMRRLKKKKDDNLGQLVGFRVIKSLDELRGRIMKDSSHKKEIKKKCTLLLNK